MKGFHRGIAMQFGGFHTIKGLTLVDNSHVGILADFGSSNNKIKDNTVHDSVRGIGLLGIAGGNPASENAVENNRLIGNSQNGIQLDKAVDNKVQNNTLLNNFNGVELFDTGSTGNKISKNIIGKTSSQAPGLTGGLTGVFIALGNIDNEIVGNTFFGAFPFGAILGPGVPDNVVVPNNIE